MNVFVAGGTGAIGRPLVRHLIAAGHEVTAMTRREERRAGIEALGARAVVADALDRASIHAAIERARPQAVIDVLTALPPAGPIRARDFNATNRLRRVGTANVLDAAVAGGAGRYVAESVAFFYRGSGTDESDEETALLRPDEMPAGGGPVLAAVLEKEGRVLEATRAGRIEGVVLRYGGFYGPETGTIESMADRARRGRLILPGGGPAVFPWIHVEDAAAATVAAVERGRPGQVYNVADDGDVSMGGFAEELARVLGLRPPRRMPVWLGRIWAPYGTRFVVDSRVRVSNRKARRDLRWSPAYPTYREGLADVAAVLSARTPVRPGP